MKKRPSPNDIGSDQPIISLLGAEDLLPLSGETDVPSNKLKSYTAGRYDYFLNGFSAVSLPSPKKRTGNKLSSNHTSKV